MTPPLLLFLLIQLVSIWGVYHYLRHLPCDRQVADPGGVAVLLSLRANWPGADDYLARLARQTVTGFRLIAAIPRREDPVFETLLRWQDRLPGRIEIVVAGHAVDEGQKVRKLRAALGALRPGDRFVVFLDSDYDPPARLIGRLLFPLTRGKAAVTTGYRWLMPPAGNPLLGLVAAVDLQVAMLPRPPRGTLPWGGAMAMTRETVATLDLGNAWRGRLSDDLTLANLLRRHGIAARPVRDLLVPTPMGPGVRAAAAFGVRQYRHAFWNVPRMWVTGLAIAVLQTVGWGWALAQGGMAAIAIGYLAAWLRLALRHRVAHRLLAPTSMAAVYRTLAWDAFAPWLVCTTHLGLIVAGACSRTIRWAGTDYRVARDRLSAVVVSQNVSPFKSS